MAQRTRSDSATKLCTLEGCDRPLRARGVCSAHYKQLRREQTGRSHHRMYDRDCETCGTTWQTPRPDARFCTAKCKGAYLSDRNRKSCPLPNDHAVTALILEADNAAKAAAEMARAERKSARMMEWRAPRDCRTCGAAFCPIRTSTQLACSPRCSRIMECRDRRVRVLDAYVEPVNWRIVYKRDGAACYLCGYDTNPNDYTLRVGRDGREAFVVGLEYPSVDHVVPLSGGGRHELANARLAHTYCNTIKSDRPLSAVAA